MAFMVELYYGDIDDKDVRGKIISLNKILDSYKITTKNIDSYLNISEDARIEDITDQLGYELTLINVANSYAEKELPRTILLKELKVI